MPNNHKLSALWKRQNGKCGYCGKSCKRSKKKKQNNNTFTVDHIVPKFLGGMNTWENVWGLCRECNLRKGFTLSVK